MTDSRTSNVIKNSTASLIYKFIQIVARFAIRTVFINCLGKEYTGISSLFTDILHVISLMELGLDASMIYSLFEPIAKSDKKRISALLKFYKNAFNLIGVLVLLIGLSLTPFLHYFVKEVPDVHEDIRIIFMAFVLTSSFSYFLIYRSVLFRADQKSRIISNISTFVTIIETIIEIILIAVFRNYYAYLAIHFIATVGRNVVITIYSMNVYKDDFSIAEAKLTRAEKRKLYRDLACLTVYNLSGVVINSTDSIFISAFVGISEVAIMGNFTLIINHIRTAVNQIVNATRPSIGNLAATSSSNKQEVVFNRMNFIAFCVTCFCCTCFCNLLNQFVGEIWFNPTYKISMRIIILLVINFFIAVMVFPVESFRGANGLFVQGWIRPAIMALLNIIFNLIMGKAWGIFGILFATTASRLLTQVWYDPWLVYKMIFRKSSRQYFISYVSFAGITASSCYIAYIFCNLIKVPNVLISFGFKAIISCIIPVLLIWMIYHKTDDFNYMVKTVMKLLHKIK